MKKWLALALKIAVSAGLIWYLISSIDLGAARHRLAQANPAMLLIAAGILMFQMIIAGFRWRSVLNGIGVSMPYWEVVRLFYIGSFFNQTLPGGAGGDAVRVYLVYKAGSGFRGALNGVVLERVVTVLALVLLVVGTGPFFFDNLDAARQAWLVPSVAAVTTAAVSGLTVLCLLDRFPPALRRWRVIRGMGNLAGDARAVFLRVRYGGPALVWSIVGHVNVALCVYALALGLQLEITAFDCIVLTPPVLLVMTAPVSIGAWGVRENAMVIAFGLIGVSAEAATVLGLLLGLATLAVAIPGGLIWLANRSKGAVALTKAEAELNAAAENRTP